MKKEIEIKILNIDPKKLRPSLKKMGGKQVSKPTLMHELYLESPVKKQAYSSFRLRTEGKRTFLTLKVKKKDKQFEVRNEHEVEVSEFDVAKKILELAGFKVFREREKIRESYRVGNVRVEIDKYPKMMPYIEIESQDRKEIKEFIEKIGFPLKYSTRKTATEIIRNAGLDPDNLVFSKK